MITFRAVEKKDLEQLRDWRNSDRVRRACREYRLLNMVSQEIWFQKISIDRTTEMFIIESNNKSIGVCGLTNINWKDRHAEVSYYLGSGKNKHGNGTAALAVYEFLKKKTFEEYGLNRLWGEIYTGKKVVLKIALKSRFKEEGRLREGYFLDGKFGDSVIVSVLAKEYFKQLEEKGIINVQDSN